MFWFNNNAHTYGIYMYKVQYTNKSLLIDLVTHHSCTENDQIVVVVDDDGCRGGGKHVCMLQVHSVE